MQRIVFSLALLFCVSQGRRIQSLSTNEAADSSEALTKLLFCAKPSAAFNANLPGVAAGASQSFVGQRRCLGDHIKLMDGSMDESDFEDDDYDEPERVVNAPHPSMDPNWNMGIFFEADQYKDPVKNAILHYTGAYKELERANAGWAELKEKIEAGAVKGRSLKDKKTKLLKKRNYAAAIIKDNEEETYHDPNENKEIRLMTEWKMKRGVDILHEKELEPAYEFMKESWKNNSKNRIELWEKVPATVVAFDDMGVIVEVEGAKSRGFIPNKLCTKDSNEPASNLLEIGQKIEAEIVDEDSVWDGTVRLSMQDEFQVLSWQKINEQFSKDESINATIRGVTPAGVAMSIFGAPAFLPISHVAGEITEDDVGKKLECKYLDVDPNSDRIVLSNRRAMADKNIDNMEIGKVIEGTVVSIQTYGVFIDVGGMSGLLHVSQVSMDHIEELDSIVPVGSTIKAMVINADKARGRVALSTKTLEEEPGDMIKDPQKVFANAERAAVKYQERMEQEKKAREEAAQDVLFGLQALTSGLGLKQEDLNLGGFGSDTAGTPPPATEE